jgi:hypothetical protein
MKIKHQDLFEQPGQEELSSSLTQQIFEESP